MSRRAPKYRWRYKGLTAVAAQLGRSRRHLFYVLEGQRHSPALARAARRLLKQYATVPKHPQP